MPDFTEHTRERLLAHALRYPQAGVQDYMKFLYQSSFGCEHLVADVSAAAAYIRKEAEQARAAESSPRFEELDGPYCRVSLRALEDSLSPETFAALFARSAEHHSEGRQALEEKLQVLRQLTAEGELPLNAQALETCLNVWAEKGYPACHHSQAFRDHYAPAYRLMKAQYVRYLPLFCEIDRRLKEAGRLTVVIDGMCGSGKTTLARLLADVYGCTLFQMDDFYLRPEQRTPERYAEPGGNVDRERFLEEVLVPLRKGQPFSYRKLLCPDLTLDAPTAVTPTPLVVIEGTYSLHPELRSADQLSVFHRIDPEEQMRRIISREGAAYAKVFESRWIPLERLYFNAFKPWTDCDFVFG